MTAFEASPPPRKRWLPLARVAWFVVVALVVGLTLLNIPLRWLNNQTVCAGAACPAGQLSPADVAQLQRAGLSLGVYAGATVALNTAFELVFLLVSSLIFWRKFHDGFGIFTAVTLALIGVITGAPLPGLAEHYPALAFPSSLFTMLGTASLFLFFYLFPDGRFVPRWIVWLVPFVIVYSAISGFRPDLLGSDPYFFVFFLSALLAQVYRFWRVSNTLQRQQTKWAVFGLVVGVTAAVLVYTFFPVVLQNTVGELCFLLIPLSIGMAILRSHLWDIDILIRRTLIYGVLTALLALVYLGAVVALQAVFTALTGQQRSEVVTVISTLVIAALFVPLRNRIQALIDRRLYRRKYDAARTLAAFGAALRDEVNLDDLSAHLLTAVDETMQPESVALWLVKPSFDGRGGPSLALGEWMQVDQAKTQTEGP